MSDNHSLLLDASVEPHSEPAHSHSINAGDPHGDFDPRGNYDSHASFSKDTKEERASNFASNFAKEESSKEVLLDRRRVLIRAVAGEFLVTFLFMFVAMAVGANFNRTASDTGYFNPVVFALCPAFAATALIYAFADISGAHFNPAVTFATIINKKTAPKKGLMYIGAQLLASVFAALAVWVSFPGNPISAVAVKPRDDASIPNIFFTEFFLTFIFVYVIFAVAFDTVPDNKNVQVVRSPEMGKGKDQSLTIYTTSGATKAGFAPIAIGYTLGACCFLGGSVSGGAFNPARVFGSALVGNVWTRHWLYWISELLGAGAAGLLHQYFFAHTKKD